MDTILSRSTAEQGVLSECCGCYITWTKHESDKSMDTSNSWPFGEAF